MTEFLSAILTGTPNRSDNGARRWPVVVYAGIASLVAAAIFVVASSVVSNPRNALYGTLLIGAGVPAFGAWRRQS